MVRNLAVAASLVATLANASAGTMAIGTASARGDMRVDQYKVNGNATFSMARLWKPIKQRQTFASTRDVYKRQEEESSLSPFWRKRWS